MTINDLTRDTTIFGIPYINKYPDDIEDRLEVYKFKNCTKWFEDDIVCVYLDTIIGSKNFYLEVPAYIDFDEGILIKHDVGAFWIYTTNEQLALEYFQMFLDGKFPDNRSCWDECQFEWINIKDEINDSI